MKTSQHDIEILKAIKSHLIEASWLLKQLEVPLVVEGGEAAKVLVDKVAVYADAMQRNEYTHITKP